MRPLQQPARSCVLHTDCQLLELVSVRVVNYIDSTYTAEESHKRYYPTHTERLKELKDKYDPKRVISFPQDF